MSDQTKQQNKPKSRTPRIDQKPGYCSSVRPFLCKPLAEDSQGRVEKIKPAV